MTKYKRKSWSTREDALLASAVENETPYEEIGGQIGRTASSVAQRVYYLRKNTTVIPPLSKKKLQRAVRRVEPVIKASEQEIRAIADDNRIWLAMASGVTSAFLSFATLIVILIALMS